MNDSLTSPTGLGIYVHFPWCLTKCPYCDFHSVAVQKVPNSSGGGVEEAKAGLPHEAYADAVIAELHLRLERSWGAGPRPTLRSLFFGGGTPSLWAPPALGRVVSAVTSAFSADDLEVTVECNPSSVDRDFFARLHQVGVTRVSLGVQALDNERLAFLGRLHEADGALRALSAAVESGIPRVSADLIFGVYRQAPRAAVRDALQVADTGVGHVSSYALTIEEKTRFGALAAKGRLPLLEENQVADSFQAVSEALQKRGFEHYEISNFARPGQHSVHNMGYWMGRDYLGLGSGAFGTIALPNERVRYKNVLSPERYLSLFLESLLEHDPFREHLAEREHIAPDISVDEALMLGLRTQFGVHLGEVAALRGARGLRKDQAEVLNAFIDERIVSLREGRYRLQRDHWLMADHVLRALL